MYLLYPSGGRTHDMAWSGGGGLERHFSDNELLAKVITCDVILDAGPQKTAVDHS